MIIERYLIREVVQTFLAVTLLLLLIFLSGTFVRILADAAEGDIPARILFSLFALKGLANLVLVLPLSLFLGVLLALGRLYNDSEMAAMTACGIGPQRVLRAVGTLALGLTLAIAYLALVLAPWAEEHGHQLMDEARSEAEIEGVLAGRFNDLGGADQLLYVEEITSDRKQLQNVFAFASEALGVQLLTAEGAHQIGGRASDDRFLVLTNGHRYEGTPGADDYRIIAFREHGLRIQDRELIRSKRRLNAVPSQTLWHNGDSNSIAELQWRIAMPISALLMALLAVPLSKTNPRQGRYGRLFLGIMIYIIYNNLLTVARSALAKAELHPWLGLWWVHLSLLAVLLFILGRQRRLPAPRTAGATR